MSTALLDSARSVIADMISLGRTRFELFSTELREELARLATLLLGGLTAVVLAALGIAFGAYALILAVGEEYRLLSTCLIALAFIAASIALIWALTIFARTKERAFEATLNELARDYEGLKP